MKCTSCGFDLPEGSSFCTNCGMIFGPADNAQPDSSTTAKVTESNEEFDAIIADSLSAGNEVSPEPEAEEVQPSEESGEVQEFEDVSSSDIQENPEETADVVPETVTETEAAEETNEEEKNEEPEAASPEEEYFNDDGDDMFIPRKKNSKGTVIASIVIVIVIALAAGAIKYTRGDFELPSIKLPTFATKAEDDKTTDDKNSTEQDSTDTSVSDTTDTTDATDATDTTDTSVTDDTDVSADTTENNGGDAADKTTESKPVETAASTSKAETTKQETTKPATTKPATTKPATTKPATTKPATTKPATTKPATTKPATTKPATTKPATTKPATTKPATTKPATTKPATTKPSKTEYWPKSGLVKELGLPPVEKTVREPSEYLSKAETVYVSTRRGLNIRKDSKQDSESNSVLRYGRAFKVLAKEDGWYFGYSEYYGRYGWMKAEYTSATRPVSSETVVSKGMTLPDKKYSKAESRTVSVNGLYMRLAPTTDAEWVETLEKGVPVEVLGVMNDNPDWIYVRDTMTGYTGWIKATYAK